MRQATTHQSGRVLVLVDGSNLRGALGATGWDGIDADAFRTWASQYGRPTIEWFQGAYPGTEGFHQVLRSKGVRVHAPRPKELPDGRRKADMDVAIAVAGLRPGYGTVILVSGDGDFEPMVAELAGRGVRVVVVDDRRSLAPELLQHVEPEDYVPLTDALVDFGYQRVAA